MHPELDFWSVKKNVVYKCTVNKKIVKLCTGGHINFINLISSNGGRGVSPKVSVEWLLLGQGLDQNLDQDCHNF